MAAVTVAVFDVDHATPEQCVAMEEAMKGLAYVIHSTHSHTAEAWKLRVVLPLSREVTPDEWQRLRPAMIARFKIPADPATKDPSRLYYTPACP